METTKLNTLLPAFKETKVKAIFVTKTLLESDHRTRLYQIISCQLIGHCYLSFTQDDEEYIVAINTKRGMFLVPRCRWEWVLSRGSSVPKTTCVDLGSAPVSLSQMSWFIDRPEFRLSSFLEYMFWGIIGRSISKTYVPMTCSLAISYILRMCGYKNNLHVAPHLLYKELVNGVDNHFWRSKSREDSSCPTLS